MSVVVHRLGMNAISRRQKPIGPSAASMNGRRRPSGVWNESLQGPMTGESSRANTPSAPRTRPISVPDSVKRCNRGGRYAAVVVIENASPKAPDPRIQKRLLLTDSERRAPSAVTCVTRSDLGGFAIGGQAATDDLYHRLLGAGDRLVAVLELAEHPARQDLFERTVEDVAGHARVEVGTELSLLLPPHDDPLEPGKRRVDLDDALLQMRAARHFAHEHPHEVGIAPPRTQEDLRNAGQPVACALVRLLDGAHCIEHVPPRLAEDRLEQLLLGAEVVVQQAVGNTRLFENEPTLVLLACRTVSQRCECSGSVVASGATRLAGGRLHALPARPLCQ